VQIIDFITRYIFLVCRINNNLYVIGSATGMMPSFLYRPLATFLTPEDGRVLRIPFVNLILKYVLETNREKGFYSATDTSAKVCMDHYQTVEVQE
jgi:hypothetical protein